jgi:hypothetical protein
VAAPAAWLAAEAALQAVVAAAAMSDVNSGCRRSA